MKPHLLYPNDLLEPRLADEGYREEWSSAKAAGFDVSLFSFENFQGMGRFTCQPVIPSAVAVVYRGWMLTPTEYGGLYNSIQQMGGEPLTSPEAYSLCHHLPRWYPQLTDLTPETIVFKETDDLAAALQARGWTGCFLKDYVKSLSTDGGSLVTNLDRIPEVVAKMKKYRGQIEGGLCARQIEDFDPTSECRHFVFRGKPFSPGDSTPDVVTIAASRIKSPFFSVDTIRRRDGTVCIVELGDGQVSDLKSWPMPAFLAMLESQG
jgi:hypothetical protein